MDFFPLVVPKIAEMLDLHISVRDRSDKEVQSHDIHISCNKMALEVRTAAGLAEQAPFRVYKGFVNLSFTVWVCAHFE